MVNPQPVIADIMYPNAALFMKPGAYLDIGAVQIVESRSKPFGGSDGGAPPIDASLICSRAAGSLNSPGAHSPHALPAASNPSGEAIIRSASAIHRARDRRQPERSDGVGFVSCET